ncbi:lymphotoxin-beta isoform X2 [Prionailurus viverrinus]|uniref:lymphotoxin-beta isoform X2 n=1 Tax=Prionailurus viverrinus TaxID=61388 RepID=UPI001FF4D6EF|nr:lymphotoxin-beta isoform X2 [Prionailurus viverrinus]
MGTLGLEGRGRRPQGKGCLLLAVAGATSLVTLLLAVPITVLAVLALVPQEQGGQVTGTADPGTQAQAQQRLGGPCMDGHPGPQSWTLRPFQGHRCCQRKRQEKISAPGSQLPIS